MGTPTIQSVVTVAAAVAGLGLARWVYANTIGRRTPATTDDLQAIETALASEGGRIVRANLDRSGEMFMRNEYLGERRGQRLYNVTLRIGSVLVRRRVAVRDGAPAILLP